MTEHKEHKPEEAAISTPFTAAQEARIRELFREELANWEKKQLQERRFGKLYPPKEAK